MTGEDSITLPSDLLAPAHARSWIAQRADTIERVLLDDALLVASELVTNAVRHGRPDVVLTLRRATDLLRIEVADEGDRIPVPGTPSADWPSGRGLLIVAATAQDWGVAPSPDRPGKTVWAEFGPPR